MSDYDTQPTIETLLEKINLLTAKVDEGFKEMKEEFIKINYTLKAINKRWLDLEGEIGLVERRVEKLEADKP